jgi:hypothetical protein
MLLLLFGSGPRAHEHQRNMMQRFATRYNANLANAGDGAVMSSQASFIDAYTRMVAEDDRQIDELFQGAGSRCEHAYLDVGTNRGVQIRKLYWPKLYPKATVHRFFDEAFGDPLRRCRVCTIGVEPNPRHHGRLSALQEQLRLAGARALILRGAASDADGGTTFAMANLTRGDNQHDWSASAAPWMQQRFRLKTRVAVRTIDLARVIRRIEYNLLRRPRAIGDVGNIWMKLDVEGAEMQILPHLMLSKTICAVSFIDIEWHTKFFKQQLNLAALASWRMRSADGGRSANEGRKVALATSTAIYRLVADHLQGRRNNFSKLLGSDCRTKVIETYDESYHLDPSRKWPLSVGCEA